MVAVRQSGSPYRGTTFRMTWEGARIAAQIDAAVQKAMDETAAEAEQIARSLSRVDTGHMQAELTAAVSAAAGRRQIVISGGASYTIFHELGTVKMSAQPMIRPAIDQTAPKLTARIRAASSGMR